MKRIVAAFLALWLMLFLCGCTSVQDLLSGEATIRAAEARQLICFSKDSVLGNEDDLMLTAQDFQNTPLEFAAYHGNWHYNLLSAQQQMVYWAYAYALEQGYVAIAFSSNMHVDETACREVLIDFSLDSPLLEQNLWYGIDACNMEYQLPIWGPFYRNAEFNGVAAMVQNFEDIYWQKKLQAIEKAQQIIEQMPKGLTDPKAAEWLYRYLVEHTEYYDYDGADTSEIQSYVYDAFFGGKTHCDGLTNALGLLYNMAGINAVEKIYFATEEEAVGHTWNSFEVDGKWYNADATGESILPDADLNIGAGLYFGYADMLQEYVPYKAERYQACNENLCMEIDAHLPNVQGSRFTNAAKQGWAKHNRLYSLILVDTCNEAQLKSQMQSLANYWGHTVYWYTFSVSDGKRTIVWICNQKMK